MILRNRAVLLNAGILGGLIIEYFRGQSMPIIAGCGIFLFALANAILFVRWKRTKKSS